MADFSGTQNLLAFKGAKLMTNIDSEHPNMLYVVIPVPYNDITVSHDGRYANVGVYMQETNDKFRQACIQRRQQSGDPMDGYMPPSHQIEVSFSKDFRERAMESARKRIVAEHPEWQANEDLQKLEFNKDLKNEVYNALRIKLGSMYARIRNLSNQTYQPQSVEQAQAPQAYQPTDNDDPFQVNEDDLPF